MSITTPRRKNSRVFLLIGFLCLVVAFSLKGYQEHQQKILSFSQAPVLKEPSPEELFPSQILIPKLQIDLPVFAAKARGEVWEISQEGVSYLLGSGIPGQPGNAVIYGHNKKNLFGPIRWLKVGEEIKVINKRGDEFIYKVGEIKTVSPDEVKVLAPTQDATLTLYTCTGFLDKERFVVTANTP